MQLKCSILVLMALGDTRENDSFDKWSIFNRNLFKSTRAIQHYNQQQQPSEKRETEREREQALP